MINKKKTKVPANGSKNGKKLNSTAAKRKGLTKASSKRRLRSRPLKEKKLSKTLSTAKQKQILSSGFERISANAEFGFENLKMAEQQFEAKGLSKNYFGELLNAKNQNFVVGDESQGRYSAKVGSEGNYAPGMSSFKGSSTNQTSRI